MPTVEGRIRTVCLVVIATILGAVALRELQPALIPFTLAVFTASISLQGIITLAVLRNALILATLSLLHSGSACWCCLQCFNQSILACIGVYRPTLTVRPALCTSLGPSVLGEIRSS